MNRIFTFTSVFLLSSVSILKAQVSEQFRLSEIDPYVSSYMEPFAKSMAVSMSGGWAHTAKVHKTLGFDIDFSVSYANVPTGDRYFNPQELNMPGYSFSANSTSTISGDNDRPVTDVSRSFTTPGAPDLTFNGLKGLNINTGGMAAIQAGVGLPKGTELMFRFFPDVSGITNRLIPDDVGVSMEKTGMWGVGVKHDIKQWIPVIKKVPFLQISGLFAYSHFNTGFSGSAILIDPARLNATDNLNNPALWENQKFDITMNSFTGNLLVGVNIPVFQPFVGIGFNSSKFDGGFVGNYPVVDLEINGTGFEYVVNESEKDPLTIETKSTFFNFQAGARLKLGPVVLHYVYTQQEYSMHTFGIGATLR